MASSTLVPFLRLAMLFKCLLEPATVLQKKKKEKKGTEELPWVSKVGHFHFHESGIFRPLCLVVHNATNRTVPKHSTKCPLGFEFRWFVSGLSFVFLFVRFCYCCLVVVVVVASPTPTPRPTLIHKKKSNTLWVFAKWSKTSSLSNVGFTEHCIW